MSDSMITIRPVEPEDAAELRANCFSQNTLAQVQERIAENLQAFAKGKQLQLVAEVDGIVVGTAVLMRKEHPLFAHRAEVVDVVVDTPYQRRGIARRLVDALCDHAASIGLEIIEISCRAPTVTEEIYRRLGFIEYGRLPRGIKEPGGEQRVYDEVFFYRPVLHTVDHATSDRKDAR